MRRPKTPDPRDNPSLARGFALVAILRVASVNATRAQESLAVDHATRVLDLLDGGKFEEVTAEFMPREMRSTGPRSPRAGLEGSWLERQRQIKVAVRSETQPHPGGARHRAN
jgi:hypothetical protein